MICHMNEKFNKEIDIIKNQTVILQVKKSMNKIKSTIENFNSSISAEGRIFELEDKSFEIIPSRGGKKNKK